MNLFGVFTIKILEHFRKLFNFKSGNAIILMYHGIVEVNSDPWSLAVSPQKFEEQLDVLSKYYRPISLGELRKYLHKGYLPEKSVVITFDDGYANNLYNARPILEKYDIPATVFITTGYIGQDKEYWWDELERLFIQPGDLPESLSVKISDNNYDFYLSNYSNYSINDFNKYKDWISKEEPPTPRHSVLIDIWKKLKFLKHEEQKLILNYLHNWSGISSPPRSTHRPLTDRELSELAKCDLIEIGCHTVTHPSLSILSKSTQKDEILNSKSYLEETLGCEIKSFSYPYGTTKHYNDITMSIIKDCGFSCACSNNRLPISNESDIFQLDRLGISNCDGEEFQNRLSNWLVS